MLLLNFFGTISNNLLLLMKAQTKRASFHLPTLFIIDNKNASIVRRKWNCQSKGPHKSTQYYFLKQVGQAKKQQKEKVTLNNIFGRYLFTQNQIKDIIRIRLEKIVTDNFLARTYLLFLRFLFNQMLLNKLIA